MRFFLQMFPMIIKRVKKKSLFNMPLLIFFFPTGMAVRIILYQWGVWLLFSVFWYPWWWLLCTKTIIESLLFKNKVTNSKTYFFPKFSKPIYKSSCIAITFKGLKIKLNMLNFILNLIYPVFSIGTSLSNILSQVLQ